MMQALEAERAKLCNTETFLSMAHFHAANDDWAKAAHYMQRSIETYPVETMHPVIAKNEIARRQSKLIIYQDLINLDPIIEH